MLDRRSLFKTIAAGLTIGATATKAPAKLTVYHTEGFLIPEDMEPTPLGLQPKHLNARFDEVRELVDDFERYGCWVDYSPDLGVGFGNVDGIGREPLELRCRLKGCNHKTMVEYLELTGRISGARHLRG